jgi:Zn-finger nucleic acid-binding protein
MNFISWTEGPITEVELKYCERCGGLWLRLHGNSGVYCASCRAHNAQWPRLDERPSESPSKRRLRRPNRDDIQCQARIKSLQGTVEPEVRL